MNKDKQAHKIKNRDYLRIGGGLKNNEYSDEI